MKADQCGATHPNDGGPEFVCDKKKGHSGKHEQLSNLNSPFWTDGGAKRVRAELAGKKVAP